MQYKEDSQVKQATHGELYAEVYRCYAPALFAYVCRHVSSREDVEDIVLEVFLSVLQNQQFPTFGQEKQKAWLWAITRNKTVDYFRRTTRQRQISLEWRTVFLSSPASKTGVSRKGSYERKKRRPGARKHR